MEFPRHTIGVHPIRNGQYIHQRNARDYQLEKEKIIKRTKRPSRGHSSRKRNKLTFRQRQLMKHAFMYQLMMNMGQATLIMMRILTSQSQPTHQKTATFFDWRM